MKGFDYLRNVATLKLNEAGCTGCGLCSHVCPHQVFMMQDRKAAILDADSCMECGACALNCPVKAITVDSGVGCASGMITEWRQSLKIGGKGAGGCS